MAEHGDDSNTSHTRGKPVPFFTSRKGLPKRGTREKDIHLADPDAPETPDVMGALKKGAKGFKALRALLAKQALKKKQK